MSDIVPDPTGLGLASPHLGPWFLDTVNLDEIRASRFDGQHWEDAMKGHLPWR